MSFQRGGNMNQEQVAEVTTVRNHFGTQMQFIPSLETATDILNAMKRNT